MKVLNSILVFLAFSFFSYGQAFKKVIVYTYPKKVPDGKVWKIESGKKTIVQLVEGSLQSGTFCNAMFLSRPGIVFNINKGDVYNAVSFGIIISDFEKIPYTNDYTYSITPTSIIDKNFELSELKVKKPEDVGTKEIVFYAGETVFVGNCIASIELTEYNMTKQQLMLEKRKEDLKIKEINALKAKLSIPVDPEKYVPTGTEPVLHDSNFSKLIFSSNAVLYRLPGKKFAADNNSIWTMTLTLNNFNLLSTTGISKSYKIIDIKYNSDLKMREFDLGDNLGNPTHKLNISWSNSSQKYNILLKSNEGSEEYQFQNTHSTEKD